VLPLSQVTSRSTGSVRSPSPKCRTRSLLQCSPVPLSTWRASAVDHPGEWHWTAYDELMGCRQRYRLINTQVLYEMLQTDSHDSFRRNYEQCIEEALFKRKLTRNAIWTESLAVGSEEFAKRVGARIRNRMEIKILQNTDCAGTWVVREQRLPYG